MPGLIPLKRCPHLPSNIQTGLPGTRVGIETAGDTLVVNAANFKPRRVPRGVSTEKLHVIEQVALKWP